MQLSYPARMTITVSYMQDDADNLERASTLDCLLGQITNAQNYRASPKMNRRRWWRPARIRAQASPPWQPRPRLHLPHAAFFVYRLVTKQFSPRHLVIADVLRVLIDL